MNVHSHICRLIKEHPDTWESILITEYHIKVKKEGSLAIFNYSIGARFSDPIVQEARGIIIDYEALEVVCWPFRKFGNHNESYADDIDWQSARVLEKVDGSITKLWYDRKRDKWQFSTNATIRAEQAPLNSHATRCFGEVIPQADNYGDIPFASLDKDTTYIFELVSPDTQVIVRYDTPSLYHIGTRNNLTGEECEVDIGIKKPASYPLGSLSDCLAAANALNREGESEIGKEGFVVVDKNYHRVKIKSPDYIMMHHLKHNGELSKKAALETLISELDPETVYKANPDLVHIFKYYDYRLTELYHRADLFGELTVKLYREYDGDRGAVARIISKHPLSAVGFYCLTDGRAGSDLIRALPVEKLMRLIPDYEEEDLHSLFLPEDETK